MVVIHLVCSIFLHVLSLFKERIFNFIEIFSELVFDYYHFFRVRYFISYQLPLPNVGSFNSNQIRKWYPKYHSHSLFSHRAVSFCLGVATGVKEDESGNNNCPELS